MSQIKARKLKVKESDYREAIARLKQKGQKTDRKRKCDLEGGVLLQQGVMPR